MEKLTEPDSRWLLYASWIVLVPLVYQVIMMNVRIERLEVDSVRAQRLFGVILKNIGLGIRPLEGDPFIEGVIEQYEMVEIHYGLDGEERAE